ncbi:MAG: SgcJ/EcaC family oxidoreductase, partial [Planctomycetia bacterium]|nr:SgcJ/EcaC family oxidoreductase [Planctomycetia bacterium]
MLLTSPIPGRISWRALAVLTCSLLTSIQANAQTGAKPKPRPAAPAGQSDPRADDRAGIQAAMTSFREAFKARDAKAMTAHWTAEGEYRNQSGVQLQGRVALEQAFAAFFAKTPELKVDSQPEALRFLSRDSAVQEGVVNVQRGAAEPMVPARFTALLVREDGSWRLASLVESPKDDVSVADIGWIVGEWKSTGESGAEIDSTYTWSANKKFIHGQFSIKEKELTLTGAQIIGVDPATGMLHSWTFEADGGVGEADWSRDGDHWVLEAAGTMTDGSSLSETNLLRRVNDDSFTWQSIDRLLDDEELADL